MRGLSVIARLKALFAATVIATIGASFFGASAPLLHAAEATSADTKGTDFWLGFGQNFDPAQDATFPLALTLFITGDTNTTGKVQIPALSVSIDFSVTAGAVTSVPIPATAQVTSNDLVEQKGVHVTALDEVTVYGLNRRPFSTDAYLALPADILGTEYIALGYANSVFFSTPANQTEFLIVGTQPDTHVVITPTTTTAARIANVPYSITLQTGGTYQLRNALATADLSGSIITSDRPVAVFGGHSCANVPQDYEPCDYIVEQLTPTSTWGKSFITMPLASREFGDTFRFVASTNATEVRVNGAVITTLNRGQVFETVLPESTDPPPTGPVPAHITSTAPILVAQYSNSTDFDGNVSDPFMVLIPPLEQFQASYTVTTPATGFTSNFINVVVPTVGISSLTLDGAPIPPGKIKITGSFTPVGTTLFSAAQISVDLGPHHLQGAFPFGITVYGFAAFDSYGYPGGMSLAPIAVAASLAVTPKTAFNPLNTQHCVTASLTDQLGAAVAGARIDFKTQGVHSVEGFAFTNATGEAPFCYTGTIVGVDTITATQGTLTDSATKTWQALVATDITVTPESAINPVGAQHCVTATVLDQIERPLVNAKVDFTVAGAHSKSGSANTDSLGQAGFCYVGTVVGDDAITATQGTASDSAGAKWVTPAPVATTLTLSPKTAVNPVGTQHCVTATLTDQFDAAMADQAINFAVSGTHTAAGSSQTNVSGQATFCYNGTAAGADTITATRGTLSDTAAKQWQLPIATTLTLSPKTGLDVVGVQHCVTATMLDQFNQPLVDTVVAFTVSGKNPASGGSTTNATGQAGFCYVGTVVGDDAIVAAASEASDTAAETWRAPASVATSLVLSPKTATNPLGTQHCVTATVTTSASGPVSGTTVNFAVTGSNPTSGSSTTNPTGQAPFCYIGTVAGTDTITATAGSLTDTASKLWECPVPLPTKLVVSPKTATNPVGTEHCVVGTITDQSGKPLARTRVTFQVTGANSAYGSATTNSAGEARFCYVGNNAGTDTIVASAGNLTDSASKIWQAPPRPTCVRDADYWLEHPNEWPVSSMTLGTVTYGKADLLKILETSVRSEQWMKNGLVLLAGDLLVAKLNQAAGASVPAGVTSAIAAADAIIGRNRLLSGQCWVSTATVHAFSAVLDAYNEGALKNGPVSCDSCGDDDDDHGDSGQWDRDGFGRKDDRNEKHGPGRPAQHRDGDGCLPGHHGHKSGDRCRGREDHHAGDGCNVRDAGHAETLKRGRR